MGGADTLLYLLHPVPTPNNLSTRGSTIPSVSIYLADHHLTQLPAQSTGSLATGQHHLGIVSSAVFHVLVPRWISSTWTGLGGISAKPSPEKVRVCLSSICLPSRLIPWSDNAFPGAGHFNRLGSPPLKVRSSVQSIGALTEHLLRQGEIISAQHLLGQNLPGTTLSGEICSARYQIIILPLSYLG
ncbi:hypothetical protein ACSBR2_042059 [Camellia fascicularis]